MGILVGSNEIRRLLNMRGNKRLGIKNDITEQILEHGKELTGLKVKFLESRNKETNSGSWTEYNILLEVLKLDENNVEYLSSIFGMLSSLLKNLKHLDNIDSIGIQEVDCSLPKYYYFLIYIQSHGKDQNDEEI